ncbi:hypothetical protein SynPROS71_00933 [Synechococcus sp. PROS-7-1]|nr:hypothetical protein SynPROS71_00933 [Synechococcus sp. PROS-7-1]
MIALPRLASRQRSTGLQELARRLLVKAGLEVPVHEEQHGIAKEGAPA